MFENTVEMKQARTNWWKEYEQIVISGFSTFRWSVVSKRFAFMSCVRPREAGMGGESEGASPIGLFMFMSLFRSERPKGASSDHRHARLLRRVAQGVPSNDTVPPPLHARAL